MGLAYIVSVVSLFDEYVNDLLYLREGSCLPRYNNTAIVFHFKRVIVMQVFQNTDLKIKVQSHEVIFG